MGRALQRLPKLSAHCVAAALPHSWTFLLGRSWANTLHFLDLTPAVVWASVLMRKVKGFPIATACLCMGKELYGSLCFGRACHCWLTSLCQTSVPMQHLIWHRIVVSEHETCLVPCIYPLLLDACLSARLFFPLNHLSGVPSTCPGEVTSLCSCLSGTSELVQPWLI